MFDHLRTSTFCSGLMKIPLATFRRGKEEEDVVIGEGGDMEGRKQEKKTERLAFGFSSRRRKPAGTR